MVNENRKIVFVHVPKCAGTSFKSLVRENGRNICEYPGLKAFLRADLADCDFLGGHQKYGLSWFMRGKVQYLTFLRDPVERCISYYYFVQEWHKHPCYSDAVNNDILGFYGISAHRNMQTQYIGGLAVLPDGLIPDSLLLSIAKKRLANKILFGIVEQYDRSVIHICRALGYEKVPILNLRHAKQRPETREFSPDTIERLKYLNRLDMDLYQYGLQLFEDLAPKL
jgi:hypothetical protein